MDGRMDGLLLMNKLTNELMHCVLKYTFNLSNQILLRMTSCRHILHKLIKYVYSLL